MQQTSTALFALVRASHPLPAVGVTAMSAGLVAGTDRPLWAAVTVVAAVFAGQLSVGWLNDLIDAPRDAEVGRTTKPLVAGDIGPSAVRAAAAVAASLAVLLSLPSGLAATGAHLAALISAWGYDLGVKVTAVSVVPFAFSFGLLPAFISLGAPGSPWPPLWLMAAAACLGAAAHFVNALPDRADDLATGVRGLPHRLGPSASRMLAAALVLAASALVVFGPDGVPAALTVAAVPAALAVLVLGLLLDRRPRSRAAFRAVMVVAGLDIGLLILNGVPVG